MEEDRYGGLLDGDYVPKSDTEKYGAEYAAILAQGPVEEQKRKAAERLRANDRDYELEVIEKMKIDTWQQISDIIRKIEARLEVDFAQGFIGFRDTKRITRIIIEECVDRYINPESYEGKKRIEEHYRDYEIRKHKEELKYDRYLESGGKK